MRATRADGTAVDLRDDGTWVALETDTATDSEGFRGVPWGSSPDRARERETTTPSGEFPEGIYWSDVRLASLTVDAAYIYTADKLVRGKYIVTDTWLNENRYLTEYSDLQELLTRKYGQPAADHTFWSNTLWQDDRDDWGKAVEQGHLSLITKWEQGDTRILLLLEGENYKSTLGIEYTSLSLELLEEHNREAATFQDL